MTPGTQCQKIYVSVSSFISLSTFQLCFPLFWICFQTGFLHMVPKMARSNSKLA